jgi:hypothetical protein
VRSRTQPAEATDDAQRRALRIAAGDVAGNEVGFSLIAGDVLDLARRRLHR